MLNISLRGKVIIAGRIRTATGLHIGGAAAGLDIGGIDNPIIRHPVTREPYIPGSSLRGKLRTLLDRQLGTRINQEIQTKNPKVRIHECKDSRDYDQCPVCQIFGLTPGGDRKDWNNLRPTRLMVRDVTLSHEEIEVDGKQVKINQRLFDAKTDLPFTEVKWEAAIDRITSAAVPRQNERVPADTVFGPFEFIYNIYDINGGGYGGAAKGARRDVAWLRHVFEGMRLLEEDYLGGYGSRGAGKIAFENLRITFKSPAVYEGRDTEKELAGEDQSVNQLNLDDIQERIIGAIAGSQSVEVAPEAEAPSEIPAEGENTE